VPLVRTYRYVRCVDTILESTYRISSHLPELEPLVALSFEKLKKTASSRRSLGKVDDSFHMNGIIDRETYRDDIVSKKEFPRNGKMEDNESSTVEITIDEDDNFKKEALKIARRSLTDLDRLLPKNHFSFPNFCRSQVLDGKLLGKGSFCRVYEVRGFHLSSVTPQKKQRIAARRVSPTLMAPNKCVSSSPRWALLQSENHNDVYDEDDEMIHESREFIADHCFRNGGDSRYAIKVLSKETIQDSESYPQAVMDLAVEARILSCLTDHPNIVKLRATCRGDPFAESPDYFILLDRLHDTLEVRMKKWRQERDRLNTIRTRLFRRDLMGIKKGALYEKRLLVALDLSSALAYIHRSRIIHRDLKPDNMGFDGRGDIKVSSSSLLLLNSLVEFFFLLFMHIFLDLLDF